LREGFLAPLGQSANALAKALNVPAPRINDIVRERRGISTDTTVRYRVPPLGVLRDYCATFRVKDVEP
jgi:addiction module HigA family antidote